jgi:hypothetical protein
MARMEGMVEVVHCGNDEELIMDANHGSEKTLVGWKRIVGSIFHEDETC